MGVKTTITLKEVQALFPHLKIDSLVPTVDGIIDTTYILHASKESYVLKKYEHKTQEQIAMHLELLKKLDSCSLSVPKLITNLKEWYVFSYAQGNYLKIINYYSLRKIARIIKKIHQCTKKYYCNRDISQRINISSVLNIQKQCYYAYKKFLPLKNIPTHKDGLIHGDIYIDNILTQGAKLSIVDFSDAADGRFSFELGVALSSLCAHPNRQHYVNFFLKVYNQNSRFKITKKELLVDLEYAKLFYELLRNNIQN